MYAFESACAFCRVGQNLSEFMARTVCVGREVELQQLSAWAQHDARLICISGLPGVGKSRLALHWLQQGTQGDFCRIELVDRAAGAAQWDKIARELTREMGDRHGISSNAGWVLLDNVEGFDVEIYERLIRLLPQGRILVTSRAAITHADAHLLSLGTLGTDLAGSAVVLLRSMLSRHRNQGRVIESSDRALTSIAASLDGLPAALELIAPQVALLGADEVALRLAAGQLRSPALEALSRSIALAIGALEPDESAALSSLSIFCGEFEYDAAAVVLGPGQDASSMLQRFVAQGLVAATSSVTPFFRVVGEVRRQLVAMGAPSPAQVRMVREYLATRASEALEKLSTYEARRAAAWLDRMEASLVGMIRSSPETLEALTVANILAKRDSRSGHESRAELIELCLQHNDRSQAPRLQGDTLVILASLKRRLGAVETARSMLEMIVDRGGHSETSFRARLELGRIHLQTGASELAEREASTLLRDVREQVKQDKTSTAIEADVRQLHASALSALGRLQSAQEQLQQSRSLFEEAANVLDEAKVMAILGNLALDAGDLDEAVLYLAHAMDILEQLDDPFGLAFVRATMGGLRHRQGRFDLAAENYEAALTSFVAFGALPYAGAFEGYLGVCRRDQGDLPAARRHLERATSVLQKVADNRFAAYFQAHLAGVLAELNLFDAAALAMARAKERCLLIKDEAMVAAVEVQSELLHALLARREGRGPDFERLKKHLGDRRTHEAADGRQLWVTNVDFLLSLRTALRALGAPVEVVRPETLPGNFSVALAKRGEWFECSAGERVQLAKRPALCRLLARLAQVHLERPGGGVPVDELLEHCWPAERMQYQAGLNRLRVAVATLRKLGLTAFIETTEEGYRISPRTVLSVMDA